MACLLCTGVAALVPRRAAEHVTCQEVVAARVTESGSYNERSNGAISDIPELRAHDPSRAQTSIRFLGRQTRGNRAGSFEAVTWHRSCWRRRWLMSCGRPDPLENGAAASSWS